MATSDKPKKYKFEINPWEECRGKDTAAKQWAVGTKEGRGIKPIKFEITPSKALNERKWPEKKVTEEAYYGKPKMGIILFTQQVVQMKEKNDSSKLKKAFDDLSKDIEDAVEDWLEEVASGKADNAKALKDGKAAMNKITGVEFKGAFDRPRNKCLDALKGVLKAGKVDPKEVQKAGKVLQAAKTEIERTSGDAQDAISFLMKSASAAEKDKDTDKSLQDFGKKVLKNEKEFQGFLDAAEKFDEAIENGIKACEGEMDEATQKELVKEFEKLSSLEAQAGVCMKLAKELAPEFKKIESKLK